VDLENTVGLILAVLVGAFVLYCLFRAEDL
jgi:hypothetical protein